MTHFLFLMLGAIIGYAIACIMAIGKQADDIYQVEEEPFNVIVEYDPRLGPYHQKNWF